MAHNNPLIGGSPLNKLLITLRQFFSADNIHYELP
jgi:hypothetical protein